MGVIASKAEAARERVFGEETDLELGVLCGGARSVALCEGVSRLGAVGGFLQTEPERSTVACLSAVTA